MRQGVFNAAKPQPGVGIDWAKAITQRLVCCIPFNEGSGGKLKNVASVVGDPNTGDPVFVAANSVQATSANIGWKNGSLGVGMFQVPNNGTGLKWTDPAQLVYADDFTIFALCTIDGGANTNRYIASNYEGGANKVQFGVDGSNNLEILLARQNFSLPSGNTPAVNVGVPITLAVTRTSGGTIKIYANGLLAGSATDTSTGGWTLPGLWHTLDNSNGNINWNGMIYMLSIWKRALSAEEMASLNADPWQLFLPVSPTFKNWFTLGSKITPAAPAIATGENWPTPTLVGPGTLVPLTHPAITTGESWPTPKVAGPITLAAAIPTGEHWNTPVLNIQQRIIPSGVAIKTGEKWFTAIISTLTIKPAGPAIPTGENWPTPKLIGSTKYIALSAAIPSGEKWYQPSITGGNQGLQLFIANTLLPVAAGSGFSPMGTGSSASACMITSQAKGRYTCTFDIIDTTGGIVPGVYASAQDMLGLTVRITENGLTEFAGCLESIVVDREQPWDSKTIITYHCTCLDKTSICDHRYVTGNTYKSGADVANTLLLIVQNYLNGEGITTGGIPLGGALGTLTSDLVLNFVTVANAFDQIATLSGTVWWIDQYGVLFFRPLTNLPAGPFAITETAKIRKITVDNTLSGSGATSGYRNKEYVVSNLNIVPGSGAGGAGSGNTETFTFTAGQPGVITQGSTLALVTSVAIGAIQSITVNGHLQTAVDFANFAGQTPANGFDYLWFYAGAATAAAGSVAATQISWTANGGPPAGATIVVVYVPYTGTGSSLAQYGTALAPQDIHGAPLGTCGSGIYENADQVQNISSQANLNAIAAAILVKAGGIPQVLKFESDEIGFFVGQQISVLLPSIKVPKSGGAVPFVITQVSKRANEAKLAGGSYFTTTVVSVNNFDPQNWIQFIGNLINRTANPLPVLQQESATFQTSGNVAMNAGTAVTNPYPVKRTGLLIQLAIGASAPPVGQTLVMQLYRSSLGTGPATLIATVNLPAGTPANQMLTTLVPKSNQIYFYATDVLTVNASYQITGGSPTKALGVTLAATWSM